MHASEPLPYDGSSIFVSRMSAYPLPTDITTMPKRRNSVTGSNHDSMMEKDRRSERRVGDTIPSTSLGKSSTSPFCTHPGSSLPRPTSPLGTKRVYRATTHFEPSIQQGAPPPDRDSAASVEARPTTWMEAEPQSLPGDHAPEDPVRVPTPTNHDEAHEETRANDEGSATSDVMTPFHVEEDDNASTFDEKPILQMQAESHDNESTKDTPEATVAVQLKRRSDPLPRANPVVEKWLRGTPTPKTVAVMTTLSPSLFPKEREAKDPVAVSATPLNMHEGEDAVCQGNLTLVNDIPVGRQTKKLDVPPTEDEVEIARENIQGVTAERQKLALDKDKGVRRETRLKKKRYFLRRLWKRLRGSRADSAAGGQ